MYNNKMSRTEKKKSELLRHIENCRKQKARIDVVVSEAREKYKRGVSTRNSYVAELSRKLGGRTPEKLHQYYDKCIDYYTHHIRACEREINKKQNTCAAPFVIGVLLVMLLGLGIYLGPGITGAAILDTGAIINTNSTFDLGQNVTSLRVTGMYSGSGHGIMYLNDRIVIDTALLNSTSFTDICVDTCIDTNGATLKTVIEGELTFIITQFNYTQAEEQLVLINNTPEIEIVPTNETSEVFVPETNETQPATQHPTNTSIEHTAGRSLIAAKHQYTAVEQPVFTVRIPSQARAVGIAANIKGTLTDPHGAIVTLEDEIQQQDAVVTVTLKKERSFVPGLYHLQIGEGVSSFEQDFLWGVLALNTHKSIYHTEDEAFIGMAVLDDTGHVVCDANVTLAITSPTGEVTTLSTAAGSIFISPECSVYGVTTLPDYYASYSVKGEGTYTMNLTAHTSNGIRTLTDTFTVANNASFDVARHGPTRIYPPAKYTMSINITPTEDYTGTVVEYVPLGFDITPQEGLTITTTDKEQVLTWQVDINAGETTVVSYTFDAPDESPQFYLLGTLEIGAFAEQRQWQIASDALPTMLTIFADDFTGFLFWINDSNGDWGSDGNNARAGRVISTGRACAALGSNMTMRYELDLSHCAVNINASANWTHFEEGTSDATDCLRYALTGDNGVTWGKTNNSFCDDQGSTLSNGTIIASQFLTKQFNIRFACVNFDASGEGVDIPIFNVSCDDVISPNINTLTINSLSPANSSNLSNVTQRQWYFNASIWEPAWTNMIVLFNFSNSNTSTFQQLATNNSGTWGVVIDLGLLSEGLQNVTIIANDSANNRNTSIIYFTVDKTAPLVRFLSPANNSLFHRLSYNQTFNATANDSNLTIAGVVFSFDNASDFSFNITAINLSGNWGTVLNVSNLLHGRHTVTIIANDTAGNFNRTVVLSFGVDLLGPNMTNASPVDGSSFAGGGNIIELGINVTDTFYVSNVSANISNADGSLTTVYLGNDTQFNRYNISYTVPTTVGNYQVVFFSNDTVGNNNRSTTNFSVTAAADLTSPDTTNSTPVNNSVFFQGDLIEIGINVTDNTFVGNVSMNISYPNNSVSEKFFLANDTQFNRYNISYTIPGLTGTYNITFFANDTSGNSIKTVVNFTVEQRPTMTNATPVNNSVFFQDNLIEIGINVTDNLFIGNVSMNISYPNNSISGTYYLANDTQFNRYNISYTIPALTGTYNITFFANDTSGNRVIAFANFTVDILPNMTNTTPVNSSSFIAGTVIEIGVNVTDNAFIGNVSFNITYPNNSVSAKFYPGNDTLFNRYNISYTTPSLAGTYNITFFANDTRGNSITTITNFTVNATGANAPNVTNIAPIVNQLVNYSQTIEVGVNATTIGIITNVTANITFPNGSFIMYELQNGTNYGKRFNMSFVANVTGRYNITFFANDTNNNLNSSEKTNFTVNSMPQITFVSTVPSQSITEASTTQVSFYFLAYDPDGAEDLMNSTAQLRVNVTGETDRVNGTCQPLNMTGPFTVNYSCSVYMWYYDGAGNWTVNASIKDRNGNYTFNTSVSFELYSTVAMKMSPTNLTWPTIEFGTTNKTADNDPLVINNTGNKDIASGSVTITGYDLQGIITDTEFINAQNFTISVRNGTSACSGVGCFECNGTVMLNQTVMPIAAANITSANYSANALSTGTDGQEALFFCLATAPQENTISRQTYATNGTHTATWIVAVS